VGSTAKAGAIEWLKLVEEALPELFADEFAFDQAHRVIDCLRSGKTIGKAVLLLE